ncbi:MAG TPA: hypothetical protein VK985_10400 [Rariglobus sp.]|nr:hypothetical protein [Rariglobus sp.]
MKTALADRYIRSDDFATRIDGVELAPEIWAVFAQLAQARNASEIAATLKLDIEAVQAALRRLSRRKLIQKHVLGWRAYAAASAIPEPAAPAPTPAPAPAAVVVEPRPAPSFPVSPVLSVSVTPPPAPIVAPPALPLLRFRIASDRPAAPAPVIRLRIASPGAVVTAASEAASSKWRLRPVLDAIGAKAGGGVAGQLLVYRVFLNVPSDLMQAAGLHSLSFVDDHFVATHAPLRAAIVKAARTHAGLDVAPLLAG